MKTTKLIIIISLIILGLVASSCKDDKATPSGNDPITDTLPGTPQDVGEISNSLLVSFTWTAAENSLNPVESYNLQVGTAAGKSDIFDDNVGNVTTYDVSGDEAQTLYARVQAVYTDTSASAWSGWSDGILIQASSPLSLAWTYQTGDKLRKEPVIFGDLVIFTSTDDTVYALEQSTGTKRWSYAIDTSTDLRSSVFVLGENSLYVTSVGGWYHSIDASSGALNWKVNIGDSIRDPVEVWDSLAGKGTLYVPMTYVGDDITADTSGQAQLLALDTTDGSQKWAFTSDNYILSTPVIDSTGDAIYVSGVYYQLPHVDEGGHFRMYSLKKSDCEAGSCTVNWINESDKGFTKSMYLSDGIISYMGYKDDIVGLNADTGAEIWSFYTGNWSHAFVGEAGILYLGSANNQVFAVDNATGVQQWRYITDDPYFNHLTYLPTISGNRLYFYTKMDHNISAITKDTGIRIWTYPTGVMDSENAVVVGDNKIYLVAWDGAIYAYDILN